MTRTDSSGSAADVLSVAAWCGLIFGIAEGAVIAYTRQFPAINAPYKTSERVLWVAPLLDVVLFVALAAALLAVRRMLTPGGTRANDSRHAVLVFTFLGVFGILFAPRVIHPAAILLFSAGSALATYRSLAARPDVLLKFRRATWAIPVILLSLFVVTAAALRIADVRRRVTGQVDGDTNVLVLVLDTVRRDHFFWAGDSSFTPNIDRITSAGVRYEDAWSTTSWSLPSQASILTGASPHEHGADWPALSLSPRVVTLAEYFTERGYDTGAFSSNSGWITAEYLGRGFAHFDAYTFEDHLRRTAYGRLLNRLSIQFGLHYAGRGRKAADLNAALLDYVGEKRTRPYFLFVCYMDVNRSFHHKQLNRPFWKLQPPMREQVGAYRAGLRQLDNDVGRLFAELGRRRLLDNTLVVITSDHGESFGPGHASDRYPPGHGTSLFPEQSRVPLFIVDPRRIPAARAVMQTVSIRQIPATVTALIGDRASPFRGEILPGLSDGPAAASDTGSVLATLHYDDRDHAAVAARRWEFIREHDDSGSREVFVQVPLHRRSAADSSRQKAPEAFLRAELSRLRALRFNAGAAGPK
jgi:arylsulfatase A-like enzyme